MFIYTSVEIKQTMSLLQKKRDCDSPVFHTFHPKGLSLDNLCSTSEFTIFQQTEEIAASAHTLQ